MYSAISVLSRDFSFNLGFHGQKLFLDLKVIAVTSVLPLHRYFHLVLSIYLKASLFVTLTISKIISKREMLYVINFFIWFWDTTHAISTMHSFKNSPAEAC